MLEAFAQNLGCVCYYHKCFGVVLRQVALEFHGLTRGQKAHNSGALVTCVAAVAVKESRAAIQSR